MPAIQTAIQKQKASRNVIIAGQIASGQDIKNISNQHNLSERQTYRILQDDQCQDILDHVMRVSIAHAKGINKKFLKHCYSTDDKISLDAIKQYQKNIGITPSRTNNQFIMNIMNQGGSIQFGPAVAAVLDSVIDVKPLEESD